MTNRKLVLEWVQAMLGFDWYSCRITRTTPITATTGIRQISKVFSLECDADFKFDRTFMAWLEKDARRTMGGAADDWLRRKQKAGWPLAASSSLLNGSPP
jgi:Domain of unknown function (DUF6434)